MAENSNGVNRRSNQGIGSRGKRDCKISRGRGEKDQGYFVRLETKIRADGSQERSGLEGDSSGTRSWHCTSGIPVRHLEEDSTMQDFEVDNFKLVLLSTRKYTNSGLTMGRHGSDLSLSL